jgi:hypothetical protein
MLLLLPKEKLMDNFIEMTFEEADEQFRFILNSYDIDASFDGLMYETYGDEVEFIKSQPQNRIWMYGDGDDGGTYIWSGWGFVNRIGYFLSEKPVPDNTIIQIMVGEPDLTCDFCGDTLEEEETHDCKGTDL